MVHQSPLFGRILADIISLQLSQNLWDNSGFLPLSRGPGSPHLSPNIFNLLIVENYDCYLYFFLKQHHSLPPLLQVKESAIIYAFGKRSQWVWKLFHFVLRNIWKIRTIQIQIGSRPPFLHKILILSNVILSILWSSPY